MSGLAKGCPIHKSHIGDCQTQCTCRSIASWFDTEGGLVIEKYFADIQALVTGISKKKQQ